jgi:hypothetical protein
MHEDPSTFEPWEPSRVDVPAPPAELTSGRRRHQPSKVASRWQSWSPTGRTSTGPSRSVTTSSTTTATSWSPRPVTNSSATAAPRGSNPTPQRHRTPRRPATTSSVSSSIRAGAVAGAASAIISARLARVAQRSCKVWYFADVRNRVSIELHERAGFETVTDDFWFPTVTDGGGSHLLGRVTLPPR